MPAINVLHIIQAHIYLHLPPTPSCLALNEIPPTGQIQHIAQLDDPPLQIHTLPRTTQTSGAVLLGGRIPPVPAKLAKKIMESHYVNLAELCPEYLEEINANEEESPRASKPKQRECSNILDWVQAFGTYVAIRSWSQP